MTIPRSDPSTGVDGRFVLRERIGAGNHGVVYRAHDRQLRRDVAVKRFAHVLTDDPRAMHRITREVNALARVSHPNVVTIHDLVSLPDGDGDVTPHLVMEFIDGRGINAVLAAEGPSPRSVGVIISVLEGLEACHRAQILHLDIKPANVLITSTGTVKIVDFGISRAASDLTATIAGTPQYMAPEQYDGRADERSDLYSVGCLLYETLTGRTPFAGTAAQQLREHLTAPRPDPRAVDPSISPELAAIVQRAMSIDPAQRFATAAEFISALAPCVPGAAATAPRAPTPLTAPTEPRRDFVAPVVPLRPGLTPVPAPEPALVAPFVRVGRIRRATRLILGWAIAAFIIALVPALVAVSTQVDPAARFRPASMATDLVFGWWLVSLGIASAWLVLARPVALSQVGGPVVGAPRERLFGRTTNRGLRSVWGAAWRGALPLMFPWYVVAVIGGLRSFDLTEPQYDPGSLWSIVWVLMPFAGLVIFLRAFARVRLGFGSILMFVIRMAMVGIALAVFVAFPYA